MEIPHSIDMIEMENKLSNNEENLCFKNIGHAYPNSSK